MVNSYMKELTDDGLITISNRNNRDCNYHLTGSGKETLNSLLMAYSSEIVQFYAQTKNEISKCIAALINGNQQPSFVLYGASETCELVLRALENFPQITVSAIVDSLPQKQNTLFNGFTIRNPEEIEALRPGCVLITSYAKQEEIFLSIQHLEASGIKIQRLTTI